MVRPPFSDPLEMKNAFLAAGGSCGGALLRSPVGWEPERAKCTWKSQAPTYGLNDAPAAFH